MPAKKSSKSEPDKVKEVKNNKNSTKEAPPPKIEKIEKTVTTKTKVAPVETKKEPVAAAEVDNVIVTSEGNSLNDSFTAFMTKFQTLMTQLNSLKSEFKLLEKRTSKQLKAAEKASSKRKRKLGTRAPSGFVKPTRISDELATFLSKPIGSEMARTDVTSEINKYIVSNNLRDKDNGRKILPDKALSTLLNIDSDVVLTYFNLQKYMSPHFHKMVKTDESSSVSS